MSPYLLFLIWTVSQVFSTPNAFAALRDSFWVALVISDFSCFPASYFSKTGFFRPQGNWAPERWIKSRTLYRIGYLDSMKVLSFCFLLSFWTFGQIFSSVLLFPYRSSWFFLDHGSLLRISMFPCFQFCEKREFWPHTRDSNPWKLE